MWSTALGWKETIRKLIASGTQSAESQKLQVSLLWMKWHPLQAQPETLQLLMKLGSAMTPLPAINQLSSLLWA
jgi:hypothetical protein